MSAPSDKRLAASPAATARVFVSCAAPDALYQCALYRHLAPLRRAEKITLHHSSEFPPSENREAEVRPWIQAADIVILLLSPDFFDDHDMFHVELRAALAHQKDDGAVLLPVFIRAMERTHTGFVGIQCLPDNGKAVRSWSDDDEAWTNVTAGIVRVIESWRAALGVGEPAIDAEPVGMLPSSPAGPSVLVLRTQPAALEFHCAFGTRALFGRSRSCQFPLRRAPRSVSNEHAAIGYDAYEDSFSVEALSAGGATHLNAVQLGKATRLKPGDCLTLGGAVPMYFFRPGFAAGGFYYRSTDTGCDLAQYLLIPDVEVRLRPLLFPDRLQNQALATAPYGTLRRTPEGFAFAPTSAAGASRCEAAAFRPLRHGETITAGAVKLCVEIRP